MVKETKLTLVPPPPVEGSREVRLTDLTDDELMKLVAIRAAAAFRELVGRYQRRVIAVCVRSAGSADEGREIAQEVFLSIWQSAPRYVPAGTFPSFLFTVVRNQLRSAARRRGRELAAGRELADAEPVADAHSLERLLAAEDERRLSAALQDLPEVHRQAILLRFTAELPYEEIAALCETPEGTVRSWVHHGIKKLRGLMGEGS